MKRHLLATSALALLALTACRKETTDPVNNDYTSAVDNSFGESMFNDMLKQADQAAEEGGVRGMMDACIDTIVIDTTVMPRTMLIDFGSVNCTGQDGRARRGSILVTFTGPYRAVGTVITITPQDYYVNDHKVEGSKTVTNLGPNTDGHTQFAIAVNGTITAPNNAWTSTHTASRVRTWIQGEETLTPWDDVYLITGNGSGTNRNGVPYTLTITQALRVEVGCWHVVSGKLEITPQGLATRYVDFGNGSCDGTVTVTVNGFTFTFG